MSPLSLFDFCFDALHFSYTQEPETPEEEFASLGISETLKRIITDTTSLPIREPEEKKLTDSLKKTETQPRWFTEEDLKYYTAQFELSGFTGPLNYYRAIDRYRLSLSLSLSPSFPL